MLRTALRVRVAAPFALAALTLGMPSVAVADTTPTPSPTVSSPSASSTPTPSESATQAPTPSPTKPAPASPSAPSPSTTPSASNSTTSDMQPFRSATSRRATTLAAASPDSGLAGGYLAREISAGGGALTTVFDGEEYPDQGLTADGVLGLGAASVGGAAAQQALDYLADEVDTYTGSGSEVYAGSTAKLLLTVAASGGDPSDFGGTDLVTKLDSTLTDEGRYADKSAFGDFSNTIGQSLAIIGRGRATAEVPSQAIEFLLAEQCPDGGFSASFTGGDCTGDTDATAFAVQALIGALSDPDAIAQALDFLTGQQQTSGGFRNVDGDLNSNTTGVAASAFAAATTGGGDAASAALALASAQGYLSSLQLDCTYPAALRGGVAFAEGDRAELRAQDPEVVSIMTRATTQATLGLAGVSLLDVTVDTDSGAAPTQPCATSTSTPTPSSTPSTPNSTPTTSQPSEPTSTPATTPPTNAGSGGSGGNSDGGDLAYTGTEIRPLLGLGLGLFAMGAVALVVARRRGGLHT